MRRRRNARGFVANISVLLGIVAGCIVAIAMGRMSFDKVARGDAADAVESAKASDAHWASKDGACAQANATDNSPKAP